MRDLISWLRQCRSWCLLTKYERACATVVAKDIANLTVEVKR